MPAPIQEKKYASDIVKRDIDSISYETHVVQGTKLVAGEVVGRLNAAVSGAAATGNTGNGTIGTLSASADAVPGVYELECIATATDGGTFRVKTPLGATLPNATVGSAYTGQQIGFTISDGSTDFALGDKFTVTVSNRERVAKLALSGTTGAEVAYGVAVQNVDATNEAKEVLVLVRSAEVAESELVFPDTITTAQRVAALQSLFERGISVRKSA